jgi:predicted metalloprotease
MRWKGREKSTNVEDRRGRRSTPKRVGGGAVIIAILAALIFGVDPGQVLQLIGGGAALTAPSEVGGPAEPDEGSEFVGVVLRSTELAWGEEFRQSGSQYQPPVLVLFTDQVQSACGYGSAATGPFYCPGDNQVYLDLGFLRQLEQMGASGEFAMAYVIAHEVGHHIQSLTGTERAVRSAQNRASQGQANALSVRMELQADCYAGIWANYASREGGGFVSDSDIRVGLETASAIGDDRLQKMAGRPVQPESFTHGSSADRVEWFTRGYRSGDTSQCDTFGG